MKCATWADYLELHTGNLSRGGLFVPSQMTAPVGTEIAIELSLPNGSTVKLRGEVAHLSPAMGGQGAGIGVMFKALDGETTRALDAALAAAKANAAAPAPVKRKPAPPPAPPPRATRPTMPPPRVAAPTAPAARAPKFADAVEQALVDELARRIDLPPHEQLGVAPEASDAEIQEAHGRLRERYAPGIFANYGASTAQVVKNLNDMINAAHARLMNPAERRALVIAAHQPKPAAELTPSEIAQKRKGEEARAALRAGIERRVEEACAHRDMDRLDDAIRGFEQVLLIDRKHEFARAELPRLRDLKAKRKR